MYDSESSGGSRSNSNREDQSDIAKVVDEEIGFSENIRPKTSAARGRDIFERRSSNRQSVGDSFDGRKDLGGRREGELTYKVAETSDFDYSKVFFFFNQSFNSQSTKMLLLKYEVIRKTM